MPIALNERIGKGELEAIGCRILRMLKLSVLPKESQRRLGKQHCQKGDGAERPLRDRQY
ncbi:hypothetical protein [Mastigocladopsis repens]|uniref:hypothetical protein n=1 Tax=Mastigocladopsis repens TaxID=221287 RepID=UPI0012EAD7E4|nr:hypothetical protein [Mastigocladopsis repens]